MFILGRIYNSSVFILLCAILGIMAGFFIPSYVLHLKPLGDIFVQLIKMMLIPVILFTIIVATANLGKTGGAAKIGLITLFCFFIASCIAALVGIVIANFFQPGSGVSTLPKEMLILTPELQALTENISTPSFLSFLQGIIPINFFDALNRGSLIQILFFAIFFGLALSESKHKNKDSIIDATEAISESLMWMVSKIMYLAPLAVFSLISYFVATIGLEVVYLVGKLFVALLFAFVIWVYVILGGLVALISKVSYVQFIKNILPVQLMALSTSSSLVSLPTNIKACENMNINPSVYRLVLPLGANLNMNGSGIFYAIVTVFFAQMFNIELDFTTYILIALTASLGSMATPGVPGLSLTILMVMVVANVPLIGLPLIFALDRVLDMFITSVNVIGDTAIATIADRFATTKG